jgi:hypothetical protein
VSWQRSNIQSAAAYVRERISSGDASVRTKAVYEGLLEVLEPARRTTRLQREAAESARAAVTVQVTRDRRSAERRHGDRRRANLGPPGGLERRRSDRRAGADRRNR